MPFLDGVRPATLAAAGCLAMPALVGTGNAFSFGTAPATSTNHLRSGTPLVQTSGGTHQAPRVSGAAVSSVACLALAGGAALARRRTVARRAEADIPRPEDLLESPKFPMYLGSTGGYLSKNTSERHAITWTAKKEEIFEMPTGGSAVMNKGENLCYFRKKEQCICVGKALKKMKITDYKIYRLKKDGTVMLMHPADGVFPEKVNKGRIQVNGRPFPCGANPEMAMVKWTKYHMKPYEADPLTTMFVKARGYGMRDIENLFPLPDADFDNAIDREEAPAYTKKLYEALLSGTGSL